MLKLSNEALENIDTCVHCGFCLPVCPTYQELGNEDDSPRGRIHLIQSLANGEMEPTPEVTSHLDLCLDCRACETACPSGVKYGAIIEDARTKLAASRQDSWAARTVQRFFMRGVFPEPKRMRTLIRGLRLAQRLKLDRAAARLGLVRGRMAAFAEVGRVPEHFGSDLLPERILAKGKRRYTVALLQGCISDVMFGPTNLATVRVLAANGCDVLIPSSQTCCGALAFHFGDAEQAQAQARRNIDAFLATDAEYFLVNAAGCGSTLKEYDRLLADDPAYAEKARTFAGRVRDITEFLADIDLVPPTTPVPLRVTYQDACHLAHGQGIRLQPRKLLGLIPGLELVPLRDSDTCCGSGGIYNLVQGEMADAILKKKMANVAESKAQVVAVANPGCLMQIRLGAHQYGPGVEVMHVIDLLDRAYGHQPDEKGERQHG